jgi:hypothetical protein
MIIVQRIISYLRFAEEAEILGRAFFVIGWEITTLDLISLQHFAYESA